MFNYLKQKNKNNSGFTLVETLVAISIFSVSIVALMSVLANGISDTNYAKDKRIATFLAEEGIEYVRNIRDTYVNYSDTPDIGWTNFLTKAQLKCKDGCSFNDSLGSFDITSLEGSSAIFSACDVGCSLFFNVITGVYSYNQLLGGVNSGFVRKITINQTLNNPKEIKVTSTVSWSKGTVPYSITFSNNLSQWK